MIKERTGKLEVGTCVELDKRFVGFGKEKKEAERIDRS